jgi:hypothetical protein
MIHLTHYILLILALLGIPAILAVFELVLIEIEAHLGFYSGWTLVDGVVTAILLVLDCIAIAHLVWVQ